MSKSGGVSRGQRRTSRIKKRKEEKMQPVMSVPDLGRQKRTLHTQVNQGLAFPSTAEFPRPDGLTRNVSMGLTKLEWMVGMLVTGGPLIPSRQINDVVRDAYQLLQACEKKQQELNDEAREKKAD